MAYLEKCRQELDQIAFADDTLAQLQKHREKALKEALAAARELSQQRKAAAQSLEKQILTELQELNMGSIRFQVAFVEKKLDATGMDEVRFLMSANVGGGASSYSEDRLRRRVGPDYAGHEKCVFSAGKAGHYGL